MSHAYTTNMLFEVNDKKHSWGYELHKVNAYIALNYEY